MNTVTVNNSTQINNFFNENGFVVINNVFTKDELQKCKQEITNYINNNKTIKNAGGITIPDFIKQSNLSLTASLKDNETIHKILEILFKTKNYRFCQHNDIGINRIVGWHKDKLNGEVSKYETIDIWSKHNDEKHEIVKVLIYLDEHGDNNDGLKIVPKSHLNRNINPEGYIQLNPELGDVVIFDQRITHRGMERQVQYPRMLVSFGFGKNNIFTDNFERGTVIRQNKQNKIHYKNKIIKVTHIYASNAKTNSGDFMIGIATKKYFKEVILKTTDEIKFIDMDCRNENLYNNDNIHKLNNCDYIIVGSGGLILPDSSPNKISCWQWLISKENIEKITKPIYVISIGWNLFYGQNMNMPNRINNFQDKTRTPIFKENISTLINKSKHFTLRHKTDVKNLLDLVGEEYKSKVNYEMCPTVWYVNKYWKPILIKEKQKYIAIEIKDDRQWRRYHKISINNYYNILLQFVKKCINEKKPILYLSHDGSKHFYNFLNKNNVSIPYLDNTSGNENKILNNYSNIHTIYCSAGHSQMISYGLGIKIISLISHPKLKNFCDDIGDENGIDINNDINKLNITDYITYKNDIEIIKLDNIKSLDNLLLYESVVIYGKGPTFRVLDKTEIHSKQFIICINDTINFCDNYDMLVINDIITWDRIQNEKIEKLKYILTPLHPHFECRPLPEKFNMNYTINLLKNKNFKGKLIFYNLLTTPILPDYITLETVISGANTAVEFVMKYMNINFLKTIGIGIINKPKYNDLFLKTEGFNSYNSHYLNLIRNHIVNSTKNIKYCDDIGDENGNDINKLNTTDYTMYKIDNKLLKTFNPHLYITKKNSSNSISDLTIHLINEYIKKNNIKKINLLDIGGGKGWGKVLYDNKNINYYCLDLKETKRSENINYIKGDITDKNLNLNMKFDIIFSKDTFEHILNPWDATNNLKNLLKNNGLILFFVPFSWRYHASPYDTYRYTHTGLQYLIERLGQIKKISAGYIRFGNINGFWKNGKDHTIDNKPHIDCLESFYIGIKDDKHNFNINNLDSDFSWDHSN